MKKDLSGIFLRNSHEKEFAQKIRLLGRKHETWRVFEDFCAMAAITISNSVDRKNYSERAKALESIEQRYQPDELKEFAELFFQLSEMMERAATVEGCCRDMLGDIYMGLDLGNHWKGQYFTPQHIAHFMAAATYIEKNGGITTLLEPACGSGVMVLSFANVMQERKANYQKQLLVTAIDIDLVCVYMAYIQFSLYGIPAVVIQGNSLSHEYNSFWYTPLYVLQKDRFDREVEAV